MKGRQPQSPRPWQQASLALMIPALLVSGPLVGFGLGWVARRLTGWGEWVMWVCVILGFLAGVRETILVIKRLS